MGKELFLFFWVSLFLIASGIILRQVEQFANSTIYDHPSKCFSCERDVIQRLGPEWGWLGQKAKSFDAEREMIRMTGDVASAIDTHPIKYY